MNGSIRRRLLAASVLMGGFCAAPAFAATVAGVVSDAQGVKALAGAEVELVEIGRVARTGDDGSFRFADVPAGRYTLRARYAGGAASDSEVEVSDAGILDLKIALSAADEVLVIGQRAILASSISRQRASDTIESVVTRDAIGQFPDQNVAEATRRLTGVNILNDQGEGRFIAVRGLDPSLNAASVNGTRLPAPEADTRSVALDVIPSELIESIEIKKTLTPDMDADTIGASIEINTTKGFDRKKPFVSVKGEGSFNNLNDLVSPKAGVDFAYPVNDRFGFAGGFSYNRRKTSTDNIEMDGWDETDDGVVFADTLEYRDYDVVRKRIGGSLSLDFKASDTTALYARGLYSLFADTEQRGRLQIEMDGEPASGDAITATFLSDDDSITITRDLKDRFESQKIQSYELGGQTATGAWTVDYKAAYSQAEEHEFRTQDPTAFEREFEDPGELALMFDYSKLTRPTFSVLTGEDAFLDPSEYEFDKVEVTDGLSRDKEWTFQLDVARDFALAGGEFQIKAGGKARLRKKTYDLALDVLDGFDGDYTLADVAGGQSYGLFAIAPLPDRALVRDFYAANADLFELDSIDTAFESNVADYAVDEDIYAGYLMGRWTDSRTTFVAGVRMEHTKDDVSANFVELVEEGGTHDGEVLDEDTVFVTPTGFKNSYTDWLPSASLRFEAAKDVLLRAGVFKSVVRPGIGKIAPRFIVEESDDGEREGEFGNPDLLPYRAWNFDVSAEWYFAPNAVIQVGGFYKRVNNFIVDVEFEADDEPYLGVYNGVAFDEAVIPLNGERATIKGVEFNYQQAMTFLPGPFDGLLAGFNYTFTDTEGEVNGRVIPLPAASRHNYNASLGYEKGPVSLRATAAYRGEYLDELGDDADEDRYVKNHLQIDFSAKYRLTDQFQVYAEFVNLNNEPYTAFQRGPVSDRLLQFETYSWTGKFGVKATF
ncbi:MAG: TonB-dependent receptor [Pseudomonadota bacterium]|nr:TonB-dependent receptor [Pseudomonadota bacterium]